MSNADRLLHQIGNVMTPRAAARKSKGGSVKVKVTKGNRYGEGKGLCTVWMTEKKPYIPGVSYGISRVRASAVGTYPCGEAQRIAAALTRHGGGKRRHSATGEKWGFKRVQFKPKGFKAVLRVMGAKSVPVVSLKDGGETFIWKGKGVVMATSGNPLTGWADGGVREDLLDYSHYLGLRGGLGPVVKVVKAIRKHAEIDEDHSLGNPYISVP